MSISANRARIREYARAALRIPLLFAWTVAWFALRVAVLPTAFFFAAAERALRQSIFRLWAAGACAIVGARIEVRGPLPTPPYILVSNHLSYFDPIVYASILGCVFVSMAEVDTWPMIGMLARGMNTLFINRQRRRDAYRVKDQLATTVQNGNGVLLFPESTTTYGDRVLPFKPALLEAAVSQNRPVHYAAISYSTAPKSLANHAICWVDDTPFARHALRFLRLPRLTAHVQFCDYPILETDRKLLAARLHAAVSSMLECGDCEEHGAITAAPRATPVSADAAPSRQEL